MIWWLAIYVMVLFVFALGFLLTPKFKLLPVSGTCGVTIIVCARNEENNIKTCIQSIADQNYPASLLELIVVDDASTDRTRTLITEALADLPFRLQSVSFAQQQGKKKCLTEAIARASNNLIICRDADTYTTNSNWLQSIVQFHEHNHYDVVIGPITLQRKTSTGARLQNLENSVLRLISAGSTFWHIPFIASGANFAFTKKAFEAVGGYTKHLHIKSGDDVYFLQDIVKHQQFKIGFLNTDSALVYTYPCLGYAEAIQQRARWSGKLLQRPRAISLLIGFLFLIVNVLYVTAVAELISGNTKSLLFISIKSGVDFFILLLAAKGFGKEENMASRLLFIFIYPFYMLSAAIAALILKPRWK